MTSLHELESLNEHIVKAIEKLPPADPLTLSAKSSENEGDVKIQEMIKRICASVGTSHSQRMLDEYFHAGPIELLFLDTAVTEIIINGPDSIWYERHGLLKRLDDCFISNLTYRNFIARLSREAGIQASLDCPFADGKWRDCRVHLIIPPASGENSVLTLRRHPASPWTFEQLQTRAWAQPEGLQALKDLVHNRSNFLVVGCTGSGKTSVLNACLMSLESSERTLVIEDTSELKVPNDVSSKLLTRRDSQKLLREIDQGELLRQALRMRPDRLVMGEIRGGEAKDLLMAFATGHSGCMGTLHADSARQALIRLEMLIQLGAPQWGLQAVRTLIWLSLQAVVVVTKTKQGERKLDGVYRIAALDEAGFLIDKMA